MKNKDPAGGKATHTHAHTSEPHRFSVEAWSWSSVKRKAIQR